MSRNRGNRNRLFYILCALLALVSIFSLIQIIRDVSTTLHIRQVNSQVQDLMPDMDGVQAPEAPVSSASSDESGTADPSTVGSMDHSTSSDASVSSDASLMADAASNQSAPVEQIFTSPKTVILTTESPIAENQTAGVISADSSSESSASEVTPVPVRSWQITEGAIREDIQKLTSENPDCVGWLRIQDVVNLPVMYSPEGNYYETHDFYRNESAGGTLFLDTMHPLREDVQHLVIHGHNMKDGTMFGHLLHYEQDTYLKQHPTLTWITPWRMEFYDIFCVAIVSTDSAADTYLNYLSPVSFADDAELHAWLSRLKALSLHWREQNITMEDALLTLSTCIGDDRLLVVSRRINY